MVNNCYNFIPSLVVKFKYFPYDFWGKKSKFDSFSLFSYQNCSVRLMPHLGVEGSHRV